MNRSETIGQLATALAKAQGMMKAAVKDSTNPYFKQNYASLAAVWDAIREPLTKNELSVSQIINTLEDGFIKLETILMHSSGEYLISTMILKPAEITAQAYGSVISYMRRYSLSAIVGGYAEDDDAEKDRILNVQKQEAKETNSKIPPKEKEVVLTPAQKELLDFVKTITDNPEEIKEILKKYSTYEDKSGVLHEGKTHVAKFSDRMAAVCLSKIKKDYQNFPDNCTKNSMNCENSEWVGDIVYCNITPFKRCPYVEVKNENNE